MILHYYQFGEQHQKKIVILHGLLGSSDNWRAIGKTLSEHYHVILLDLRNHGLSNHHEQCTYEEMAQDVIESLEQLNINRFTLIGHSMGGKVAMAATQLPGMSLAIEKLVIVDIAPKQYENRHQDVFKGIAACANAQSRKEAQNILTQFIPEVSTIQFILKSFVLNKETSKFYWRFNWQALQTNYHDIASAPLLNNDINTPTLFIKGANSDYLQAIDKPLIDSIFKQSQAKIISDAGHWPHVEKPRLFINILLKFL